MTIMQSNRILYPKYLQWSFSVAKLENIRRGIIHLSSFFFIRVTRSSTMSGGSNLELATTAMTTTTETRMQCPTPPTPPFPLLCLASLCSLRTTNATSTTREQGAANKQWAKHPQTEPKHDVCLKWAQVDQISCMSVSPFLTCMPCLSLDSDLHRGLDNKAGPFVEPS